MDSKIGIIGAGKWGQALFFALSQKNSVKIYSKTAKQIAGFCTLEEVLSCSHIIMALPTQVVAGWLNENFRFNGQHILVAAKGIESSTGRFLNHIFEEHMPSENVAYLSGPSFAAEVRQGLPTALVISSVDADLGQQFASFFPSFIKVYLGSDVVGAEIAGAYKNVIAIASGISDGLKLGFNARAALITRGLAEMTRFGLFFGAKQETFLGLSGVGDLFLTATSELSRNYRVGLYLASEMSLAEALGTIKETAEGVETTRAVVKISDDKGLYAPIAAEVSEILDGKDAKLSLHKMLSSKSLSEF